MPVKVTVKLSFPMLAGMLLALWQVLTWNHCPARADDPLDVDAHKAAFFTEQVLPLLREHCFECHSHASGEANGNLMLDSLLAMTDGGTRGPAIVPGGVQQSILLQAMRYADSDLQMPPDEKLPDEQIAIIEQWIQEGAAVPPAMRGEANSGQVSPATSKASHWAYQPLSRWVAPAGAETLAPQQVIDQIILNKLAGAGLELSPPTSRRTLIFRLSYDLMGLPPTHEEIAAFEQDPSSDPQATAELIERCLASPHFGERWARYWMDIARYADNKGYVFQEDREYAAAYQYRDWLINAFNSDMPYDQFVTKQLAADLLRPEQSNDLPALGFLTLGRRFLNNKQDIIDDRLDVVARGLMGMTLGCARCHDHKYDPITQADYYSMAGVFLNTDEPGGEPWPHRLKDSEENRQSFILVRGNARSPGDKVDRRFVSFLDADGQPFANGSGRLELAEKIVSSSNPLTARVMANRIWTWMMGSSLVESPSDLGTRCGVPQQLQLLDHLAGSFIDSGWSIKSLVRQIANSRVYQQQSLQGSVGADIDPQNALYWRMNRRRLDFEAFRDTLLSRAGLLDQQLLGPSAKLEGNASMHRRTVYAYIDRQNLPSVFRTFDFASPDTHNAGRPQTSVPQQGLFVLNSNFMAELATQLGRDVQANVDGEAAAKIQWLFRHTLARLPTQPELQAALEFIDQAQDTSIERQSPRWIYGYAAVDPANKQLSNFQPLPSFVDGRWQGGSSLPDAQLGWCMLDAEGGHVGNDLQHAVVRRWIAPRAGSLRVSGKLQHQQDQGDGVRGSLWVAGKHHGEWTVKDGQANTNSAALQVQAGEAVDFVTDCNGSHNHDSFLWSVRLRYVDDNQRFSSKDELPLPIPLALDRWSQLSQALLATNELAFID